MKFVFAVCLLVLIVGCTEVVEVSQLQDTPATAEVTVEPENKTEEAPPEIVAEEEPNITVPLTCIRNRDCTTGLLCIDQECQTVQDIYEPVECAATCKLKEVTLRTSDGENYKLSPGRGSYSYAGALEWKTQSPPPFCKGDDIPILIELIKKNTGKILERELLTLRKGETSAVVTHPTIRRVKFTATLVDLQATC